jgi:lipoprotein signal peptidase
MKALYCLLPALGLALALDGITKVWAERSLEPHQPIPVMGEVFRLTLGYNTGVAFGMFANGGLAPVVVTGLVILGLIVWFAQALKAGRFPPEAGWPIGLLLGGAIANFADRLFDGRVTDFLDVGLGATRWPTFNLADSAIMIGIAWLLLLNYQRKPRLDPFTPPEEGSSGE